MKKRVHPINAVEYVDGGAGTEGIFQGLPAKLSSTLEFDVLKLEEQPASKRATLWFRRRAKYVFHIRLIRKSGRCLIEMGGMDVDRVLIGIRVCKQHFDQWFGISQNDIDRSEGKNLDNPFPHCESGGLP